MQTASYSQNMLCHNSSCLTWSTNASRLIFSKDSNCLIFTIYSSGPKVCGYSTITPV